jgi:hypothetical protein
MTAYDRLQEFITEQSTITAIELAAYTKAQWDNWYDVWGDYVASGVPTGGQHPPRRPI